MKRRVCYVVCYKDPEYIRTLTLVQALSRIEGIDLFVVKNRYRNILRYIEVPVKLIKARIKYQPEIFVVGFRAHEIFWAFYPSMVGKKIIFDEFINLHDWLTKEHEKISENSFWIKIIDRYMKWVMKKSDIVLEDTEAHAELSSIIYSTSPKKISVVPVGADEKTFFPMSRKAGNKRLNVFFFGNMLPLHGLDIILQSISLMGGQQKLNDIHFTLIGGRGDPAMVKKIKDFIKLNKLSNYVTYSEWVAYHELPNYIAQSDICLGGPFGNTGQAQRVVTGKTYQFLAMAKPVIVGRIENMKDFKDKQNCLLVQQGNPPALADTIKWAFNNKSKLLSIGKQGYNLYYAEYSAGVISKKLGAIIQKL
ncbi:MAG: glycosyltransferase [Candidatus Saccharimonadales bacterium]